MSTSVRRGGSRRGLASVSNAKAMAAQWLTVNVNAANQALFPIRIQQPPVCASTANTRQTSTTASALIAAPQGLSGKTGFALMNAQRAAHREPGTIRMCAFRLNARQVS